MTEKVRRWHAACAAATAVIGLAAGAVLGSDDRTLSELLVLDAARAHSFAEPTAGHDGKFFLASPDGGVRLDLSGYVQTRYIANRFDAPPGGEDFAHGFELRRTRLTLDATLPEGFAAKIQVDANRTGGGVRLIDAIAEYTPREGVTLTAGQFQLPFTLENHLSNTRHYAVERSLGSIRTLNINQGRVQGAMLTLTGDRARVYAATHGGKDSFNTPYHEQGTDFAGSVRGELRFGGKWSDFRSLSSRRGADPALLLGAGAWYANPGETALTADATAKFDGWSVNAAFFHRDAQDGTGEIATAGVLQAAVFVTDIVELFARFEAGGTDDPSEPDLRVVNLGVNWLPARNLRITADVSYAFDGMSSTWAQTVGGWRVDDDDAEGQAMARLQAQLSF